MLKQFLNLKLSQKLSPQQIQLMKLIQLPTQAFEQRLLEEMNENPALEAGKEDEYEADEFANEDYDDYDDAESDRIEADDINIDEYRSRHYGNHQNTDTDDLSSMKAMELFRQQHMIAKMLRENALKVIFLFLCCNLFLV